jgi:hypothetical protein
MQGLSNICLMMNATMKLFICLMNSSIQSRHLLLVIALCHSLKSIVSFKILYHCYASTIYRRKKWLLLK